MTADTRCADFRATMDEALDMVTFGRFDELEEEIDFTFPEGVPEDDFEHALAWAASPSTVTAIEALRSQRLDDEQGISARSPEPRTVEFEGAEEADAPEFVVINHFENRYGDAKAVVETPAPWDTPDGMTPANEVIKSLEWEEHHYSFDDGREAWTIDESGVAPLREAAEAEGYAFDERTRSGGWPDESRDANAIRELARETRKGDRLTVVYEKKNGNGTGTRAGKVTRADPSRAVHQDDDPATIALVTDERKWYTLHIDDDGEAALWSGSQYPYMGCALEAAVEPGAGDS